MVQRSEACAGQEKNYRSTQVTISVMCEIPFAQPAPTQLEAPTYIPEFRLHLCRVEGCVNLLLHRNLTTGNIKKSSLQHHSLLSYHYHYSHISPDFPGE